MSRRYFAKKVLQAILTILAIAVLNFALFRLLPGDPINTLLPKGPAATPERKAQLRESLGLDLPLWPVNVVVTADGPRLEGFPESVADNQFFLYLGNLLALELGDSLYARTSVSAVIGKRVGPTLLLVLTAEILALFFGLLIGVRAGWRRGGAFDTVSINLSLVLYAVPLFWLGMLMLYFLGTSNGLNIFPSQQMVTPGARFDGPIELWLDIAAHLVLPATTLALGLLAGYALIMRSSLIDTLSEDYITTARAKGLKENMILRRHAIPNALLPTVTLVALTFGYVLGGAIGVEQVFTWPGMGSLIVDSVARKDYPVLQGIFLLITISVVLANFLADLVYGLLDPRVRR
jgi:peptide/nickel transport system permease protein